MHDRRRANAYSRSLGTLCGGATMHYRRSLLPRRAVAHLARHRYSCAFTLAARILYLAGAAAAAACL